MSRRPQVTIKSIAAASGVSYPTVSYVLNNSRSVSPATRKRVMDAVKRLNYRPNALARGLLRKRMNIIGVVLPYAADFIVSDHYIGPILEGIVAVAQRREQSTLLLYPGSSQTIEELVASFCDGRADGLILLHERTDSPLVKQLQEMGIPIFCVNEVCSDSTVASLDVEQIAGAEALVTYLIEQGHHRIAFLEGDIQALSAQQRREGYFRALNARGLIYHAEFPGGYSQDTGYERGLEIGKLPAEERPTAICCCNDSIALGVLQALQESGLRVPEDISVVGFDDISAAALTAPGLTTMRLPFREFGVLAMESLLRQIERNEEEERKADEVLEHIVLPMQLIERGTVAPPPQSE